MALRQAKLPIPSLLLRHQKIVSFYFPSSHPKNWPLAKQQQQQQELEQEQQLGFRFLQPRCLHIHAPLLQISELEPDALPSNGSESDSQEAHSSATKDQSPQFQSAQAPDSSTPRPSPPRFHRTPQTVSTTPSQSPTAAPTQPEATAPAQPEAEGPVQPQTSATTAPVASSIPHAPPFATFGQYKLVSPSQMPVFTRPSPSSNNVVSVAPGALPHTAPPPALILSAREVKRQMIDLISKHRPAEALRVYNEWSKGIDPETLEANVPNIGLWNLSLHSQELCGSTVKDLLAKVETLRELGLSLNKDTFTVLFHAVSTSSDYKSLELVFSKITEMGLQLEAEWFDIAIMTCIQNFSIGSALKYVQMMAANGFYPSTNTLDRLVQQCCRTGRTSNALDIVKWCKGKDIYPNFPVLEDLTDGCIESANSDGALLALEIAFERQRFFQYPSMNDSFRFPGSPTLDEGTIVALLEIAAQSGNLALATKAWDILCRSLKNSRPPGPAAFLARVHASVAAGDLMLALLALLDMETTHASEAEKDIFSPFSSLSSFVSGCSRGGFATVDAAYYKVEEMANTKKKVPLSALNCLILGCSNIWDVDRAYQTFDSIWSVFGLKPNVHSYNALLDAFGKTKKIEDAVKLYDHMVDSGLEPDYQTYCLLINAHVVNRDTQAAMEVFDYLVDAGHTIDKVTASKLRRRCIRERDQESLMRIGDMGKKCKYSFGFLGDVRKRALFNLS